jgi:DNA-binding IclR family transcriptional regulator
LPSADPIPDDVRRFLLTSIPSVPHLELLMLAWREQRDFDIEELSRRLYVSPADAQSLAQDLAQADLLERDGDRFHLRSASPELQAVLAALDHTYSRHVRAVAELLHSNLGRQAHNFAKAFVWRKP